MYDDSEFLTLSGSVEAVQKKLDTLREFGAFVWDSQGNPVMQLAACDAACCLAVVVLVPSDKMNRNLREIVRSAGEHTCDSAA